VPFDGKPWEVSKAVEAAKKLCPNVIVTQVNGPLKEIEEHAYGPAGQKHAVTDSFCRESWKLAGCLKDWGKVPLVFDERDPEREAVWMPKAKKKIILVSAGSESSPFPYRDLLLTLVKLKYKAFNVVDLSEIKAERFYDLLGLYEAAHCLISVDTAHLHLAAAVPALPVMALIQDRPIYWYGTAWRPQHHFHCRYRDFPRRALELFTAIENIGSKPNYNIIQCYYGGVRANNGVRYFPIQPGSCRRDAMNCLDDKEHFPMLRDSLKMALEAASPGQLLCLSREDTKTETNLLDMAFKVSGAPFYCWRFNKDRYGVRRFFPAVDMFTAPVDFWLKLYPSIPDIVLGADSYWSRLLFELFRANGAKEVEGAYRDD
jgi:hypothetical protein